MGIILRALNRLKNVRSFAWISGKFPEEIASVVLVSWTTLETLRVTSMWNGTLHLPQLSGLSATVRVVESIDDSLSVCSYVFPDRLAFLSTRDPHLVKPLATPSLKMLAVYAPFPFLNDPQPDIFTGLPRHIVRLVTTSFDDVPGLGGFLRESLELESLTLLHVASLSYLPCEGKLLSKPRDFKIGFCSPSTPTFDVRDTIRSLITFLGHHQNLRRFDLMFCHDPSSFNEHPEEQNSVWFIDVIKAICTLNDLHVLGITFPRLTKNDALQALTELSEHANFLQGCAAIRLEGTGDAAIQDFMAKLKTSRFVALSNLLHCHYVITRPLPLTVEDLVYRHGLNKLQQAVLFDTIYDIRPVGVSVGGGIIARPWSPTRVRWRTEADFYSLDAHWLMSYWTIRQRNVIYPSSKPLGVAPE
ncbi:hypothetical protein ACEPAI_10103 [Sanghuangporus weigelae]